jgi:paraquat-inducible protein B
MTNDIIDVPEPQVKSSRHHPSLVWLVPALAVLVGLSMLIHAWLARGPVITISFQAATGLEAGKTAVKYKDVVIGNVTAIALSPDNTRVLATVELQKSAAGFAREDSRFWVVRPRIGAGGVSGVETVLSGSYIGVDAGKSKSLKHEFVGLETPPSVISDTPGKSFLLHTDDLGSLEIGSPVYYRHINVGQVAAYHLDDDGKGVMVQVFIQAPNDRFVTANTRFWNASGVDLSFGSNGLKLNTQSLATIVAGGIAFANPPGGTDTAAAGQARFVLAHDEQTAMADPDGEPIVMRLRFDQSLRGLAVGAPVEFLGKEVGRVTAIDVDYDAATQSFPVIVDVVVFSRRLPLVENKVRSTTGDVPIQFQVFMRGLVARGLRAQARPGNLLTGQLYIALDFIPHARPASFDVSGQPWLMPTVRADFSRLQEQVASIVDKLDHVPFDAIGQHLDADLVTLDKTLRQAGQTLDQVNTQVLPELHGTLQDTRSTLGNFNGVLAPDAQLPQNINQTMLELQRSARSLRTLTDMLGRHPESLVRGRAADSAEAGAPKKEKSTP